MTLIEMMLTTEEQEMILRHREASGWLTTTEAKVTRKAKFNQQPKAS
jgi:hypothetical protein